MKTLSSRAPLTADTADRHALYQASVQDADHEAAFFVRAFKEHFGRTPRLLREDFCGTGSVCAAFVRVSGYHRAVGVDVDLEPLEWGRIHNVSRLNAAQRQRVQLVEGDARARGAEPADIVSAQNYSFFIFHRRAALLEYFRAAHANLAADGLLVMDMMGGPLFQAEDTRQERAKDGFTYVWEQERFDPITHLCRFHIHFRFPDGSRMDRAFTYHWRLWTLPELREALEDAGFNAVHVYFGATDPVTGAATGQFNLRTEAPADPAWLAYVVAVKRNGESGTVASARPGVPSRRPWRRP
jgi:SAM-dependent methyltransferase